MFISADEAKEIMDTDPNVIVVDVRSHEEYAAGHIPGAICLPHDSIDADSADACLPDLDARILLYCQSGRRAAVAMQTLEELDYSSVSSFGGIDSWHYGITSEN